MSVCHVPGDTPDNLIHWILTSADKLFMWVLLSCFTNEQYKEYAADKCGAGCWPGSGNSKLLSY